MPEEKSPDEKRLRAIFGALEDHHVEYAVIGAVALGLHGLVRATADLDLFIRQDAANVERLKSALRSVIEDSSIDEISAEDLCGDYPAVRYNSPDGFALDIITRLGEAFSFTDLDIEEKSYEGIAVRVVTPLTLWRMKKDTPRPTDRFDAAVLAERFGFEEE